MKPLVWLYVVARYRDAIALGIRRGIRRGNLRAQKAADGWSFGGRSIVNGWEATYWYKYPPPGMGS